MNKKFLICGVVTVLLLIVCVFLKNGKGGGEPAPEVARAVERPNRLHERAPSNATPRVIGEVDNPVFGEFYIPPFQQDKRALRNDPDKPSAISEFALRAEDSKYTEGDIVDSLDELLTTYRENISNGHYESNSNIEITNALLGDNRMKIALLSAKSSRVNKDGMLVDSYGTPYDFHFISSKRLDIRSAGKDQELYTDDDILSARGQ